MQETPVIEASYTVDDLQYMYDLEQAFAAPNADRPQLAQDWFEAEHSLVHDKLAAQDPQTWGYTDTLIQTAWEEAQKGNGIPLVDYLITRYKYTDQVVDTAGQTNDWEFKVLEELMVTVASEALVAEERKGQLLPMYGARYTERLNDAAPRYNDKTDEAIVKRAMFRLSNLTQQKNTTQEEIEAAQARLRGTLTVFRQPAEWIVSTIADGELDQSLLVLAQNPPEYTQGNEKVYAAISLSPLDAEKAWELGITTAVIPSAIATLHGFRDRYGAQDPRTIAFGTALNTWVRDGGLTPALYKDSLDGEGILPPKAERSPLKQPFIKDTFKPMEDALFQDPETKWVGEMLKAARQLAQRCPTTSDWGKYLADWDALWSKYFGNVAAEPPKPPTNAS